MIKGLKIMGTSLLAFTLLTGCTYTNRAPVNDNKAPVNYNRAPVNYNRDVPLNDHNRGNLNQNIYDNNHLPDHNKNMRDNLTR